MVKFSRAFDPLYAREIAAATGQYWRDVKTEALEEIRYRERQMADGCGVVGR